MQQCVSKVVSQIHIHTYGSVTHFFGSKDPDPHFNADSGSWGINLRKNLLKFIAFIADILLMRANL